MFHYFNVASVFLHLSCYIYSMKDKKFLTSIFVPFCSLFLIYDDFFLDKFQKILLILLLHALVTPLLPPLNGLLVHIFRSAPRLPAYKRVNRFWPLTTLPTKYKCVFSSLHAFFYFFCGIYLSYFQSVASICRSICFCDIYLSYFKRWQIYVEILFLQHIFVIFQAAAYVCQIYKMSYT